MGTIAEPVPNVPKNEATGRWTMSARVAFRFGFCYWLLYCLPERGRISLIDGIPGGYYVTRPYVWLWHKFTPWTAIHLFHLSGSRTTYIPTGSGDTTLDYVQIFLFVVTSAIVTALWSLLDRKRKEYVTLYAWLHILVRLTLSMTLLSYGLAKIIPTQFSPPTLAQLTETYGEASPMGLLWTFMGASTPYVIFAGLAESTAAVLLLFRRTTLLGAMAAAAVMLNVAMLNYCYDVPVKLYSTNLLLMSLFLMLPDTGKLVNVFVLNRAVLPSEPAAPRLPKQWMRIGATVLKLSLFAYFVVTNVWESWSHLREIQNGSTAPIYGAYNVDSIKQTGQSVQTSVHDTNSIRLILCEHGFWMIRKMDGTALYLQPHFDEKSSIVDLYSWKTKAHSKLNYRQTDAQHLVLLGMMESENVEIRMHKIDAKQFLLTSRGYHWINELPFNR